MGPAGERRLVEAAGVEPASESTLPQDSTCVSSSVDSRPAWGRGENRQPLVPGVVSPPEARNRLEQPACLFDIHSPRAGSLEVDVAVS